MEDRLQKFTTLVEAGTFTGAAATLHISQPALTAAVQKLERELGVELLVRTGNRFQLTSAGRLAYIEGKELIVRRHNLRLQVAALKHTKVPLSIGMIDSIADMLFVDIHSLDELERAAEVSLSINNSAVLRQSVEQGQLDVAIIARPLQNLAQYLEVTRLGYEPLVFVTHPELLKTVQHSLHRGELPHFLSYNQTSTTHQLIVAKAEQNAMSLSPIFFSTSPEIILKLVLNQKGVAALPLRLVKGLVEHKRLAIVRVGNTCQVQREIVTIKHRARIFPPAAQDMFADIKHSLDTLTTEADRYEYLV